MPNHAVWSFESNQNARFVYIPEAKEGIISKAIKTTFWNDKVIDVFVFLGLTFLFSSVFGKSYTASGRFKAWELVGNKACLLSSDILFGFTLQSVNQTSCQQ